MQTSLSRPDFYMPFPSRVNPRVEAARDHSKAWARARGLFDPKYVDLSAGVWNEAAFEAADFGLFTAMTYPDAPRDELNLVTDWHVTLWFIDDLFMASCREAPATQRVGRQVDRLLEFLPVYDGPTRTPTNPAERAIADLWPRTIPGMSFDWRRRFLELFREFLQGSEWEFRNVSEDRIPDPVDYLEMRRRFGGFPLTLALLERAGTNEVPRSIPPTRTFQAVIAAAADAVDLSNDIGSYDKDVRQGELNNNAVHILRHWLGRDLQQAVADVNGLMTSRVRTLETAVAKDVPMMLERLGIDETARGLIAHYLQGVQTAVAGYYEWQARTARYADAAAPASPEPRGRTLIGGPTGLGTSAARLSERTTR